MAFGDSSTWSYRGRAPRRRHIESIGCTGVADGHRAAFGPLCAARDRRRRRKIDHGQMRKVRREGVDDLTAVRCTDHDGVGQRQVENEGRRVGLRSQRVALHAAHFGHTAVRLDRAGKGVQPRAVGQAYFEAARSCLDGFIAVDYEFDHIGSRQLRNNFARLVFTRD